jgi:hypothetical protein
MKFSDPHQVIVTVDAKKTVTCTPENVAVSGCDTVLKFVLQTAGYVFPKEGAVVVTDPGKQFPFPSRTLPKQPTKATLYDHNTVGGDFKYSVYVEDVATGKVLFVDPTIQNDA